MASIKLPQAIFSDAPRSSRSDNEANQILQILGNNPIAGALDAVTPGIVDALAKRAQLRRQTQQVAQLAQAAGDSVPADNSLTPDLYEKLLGYKSARTTKQTEAAKQRADLEFKLEGLRTGYTESNPATGDVRTFPGVQGLEIQSDANGNPTIVRSADYQPKAIPKSIGGGTASRGATQQTQLADSADGTPLFFDRDAQRFIRSDKQPIRGTPVPLKGNPDAVVSSAQSAILRPTIESYRNDINTQSDLTRRASLLPIVGPTLFPVITQKINQLKLKGFTFGGKQYTGKEEQIIEGSMIPTSRDSKESALLKLDVMDKYTNDQIDLLQAANLLGPSGNSIKKVLNSNVGTQKKAQFKYNTQTKKLERVP